jgi:molybdopterin synthase catalytic subunit
MMRLPRIYMGGNIIIEQAPVFLDANALLNRLPKQDCGAVVSFLGITRGKDGDAEVLRLEFDAWQDKLTSVLERLAQQAIDDFSVTAVAMSHRTGSVGPEEPIVAIHVASPHRKEAFHACHWLIDELKNQAPLWKKEVTNKGESWKPGLG